MALVGRSFSAGNQYRYGFNGKENDPSITSGAQDYGMRIYDTRLGRFLSVDPLQTNFAFLSPFAFAANTPLRCADMDGLEPLDYSRNWGKQGAVFNKWNQDVSQVYDKVTKQVWTVMEYPNQQKVFYWEPFNGNHGTFDYANNGKANRDASGSWTGQWVQFDKKEVIETRNIMNDHSVEYAIVAPIVAVPGAVVAGFGLASWGLGVLSDFAMDVSIRAGLWSLRNPQLFAIGTGLIQGLADPSPTGAGPGAGLEQQVKTKVAEAVDNMVGSELKAGFGYRQGNAIDPGLDNFISDLESKGIKILGKNLEIIENSTGKIVGEIDVLTTNAAIQFKNGASSAAAITDQVLNKTEPFINKAVVGFINGANGTMKGANRTVTNAGPRIMVTNDINKLVDIIK